MAATVFDLYTPATASYNTAAFCAAGSTYRLALRLRRPGHPGVLYHFQDVVVPFGTAVRNRIRKWRLLYKTSMILRRKDVRGKKKDTGDAFAEKNNC